MYKPKIVLFLIYSFFILSSVRAQTAIIGQALPPWQKGYLDLHHINTGRGSAAFFILPDGTTMQVDAGELSVLDDRTFTPRNATIKPDYSKKPYEWIASYIQQVAPRKDKAIIDYALITHFHDDHFGAWYPGSPLSASGKYSLTGITGLAEIIPVKQLIDRASPHYNYPYDFKKFSSIYGGGEIEFGKTIQNYLAFINEKTKQGMKTAALKAGSRSQIHLKYDSNQFPSFYIQNIKSSQWIWTGKDSTAISHFPPVDTSDRKTWPDENSLSLAVAIHYGPFIYYTGGDNPGNVFAGDNPLRDTESEIARVTGEVDVATLDHHGNRDAVNEFMVKTMKPRVWIGQSWSADHPGHEVLARMTNKHIYPGERDLFATNMLEANKYVIGPLIDRSYKSQQGHILVRVLPGGESYFVIILDDSRKELRVKDIFGPYQSKQKTVINFN